MDFFGRQAASRRMSRWLIVLFVIAVACVVVAVNLVVLVVVLNANSHRYGMVMSPTDGAAAHTGMMFVTTLCVLCIIGFASLYKSSALSGGGGVVARSLGGVRIDANTTDAAKKRLLNVVEEMAIASGVPMPEVYVLEQELGINAFAAGHNPSNAAISVTQGALNTLNRTELQGVIAHEFSHVLNGDMRLNIRLMGLLFGLLVVALIGRFVLRNASGGRNSKGAAPIFIAALAIMVIGYVGLFFGRLIQAAVSRSREALADASAVQFTRDPLGLRGALVKIGANEEGSKLNDSQTDEVAHMLFAPGMTRLFATHPSLVSRITALDPSFRSAEFGAMRRKLDEARRETTAAPEPEEKASSGSSSQRLEGLLRSGVTVASGGMASLVGNPGTAHVEYAQQMRQSLPAFVSEAAQQSASAQALFFALALDTDATARERQILFVGQQLGQELATQIRAATARVDELNAAQTLPALLRLFPVLRQLTREQRQQMVSCLNGLLLREGQGSSVHSYAIRKLAQVSLQDELTPQQSVGNVTLAAVRDELQILFSVLAANGSADELQAKQAYEAGMRSLLPNQRPEYAAIPGWWNKLDQSLRRLDRLMPAAKELLIEALAATVANDQIVSITEAELLRTVCATLHCPLPPLLATGNA